MKRAIAAIAAAIFLTGCANPAKLDAIGEAIHEGRIPGIGQDTVLGAAWGYGPTGRVEVYPGPFSSIDFYDAGIQKGKYEGDNATFLFGKSRQTGKWDLFCVVVQQDDKWLVIPVQPAANK